MGPLSSVKNKKIAVDVVNDSRPDKQRIGWKRNGFGQKTANIEATKPVTNIIRNTITTIFKKNGYGINKDNNVVIKGDVQQFWIDINIHAFSVDFVENIKVKLQVKDKKTNKVIYENTYAGHYTEKSLGGLDETLQRVMDKTLDNLASQISFDDDLVSALKKAS